MTTAYICMGANLGDARASLAAAAEAVAALPGVRVTAASGVYRTEPQGKRDQPWFFNQVLRLDCGPSVTADRLLEDLLGIETAMGRVRDAADRFGPRALDLDLLLFGEEIRPESEGQSLILPHPRMGQRAFVLVPLREIAPDLMLPDGQSVDGLLRALSCRVEGDRIFQ